MIPIPRASIPGTRSYVSITRTSRQNPIPDGRSSYTADLIRLSKRARGKDLSDTLARRLIRDGDGTLAKQYRDTVDCSGTLTSRDGRWESRYCRHRWCITCSKIRTARLIDKYQPTLEGMDDPYFVTLSFQNVYPEALPEAVDDTIRVFNSCKRSIRYLGSEFVAVRVLEVTINNRDHTVHPHIHVLINGADTAKALRNLWLIRCKKYGRKAHSRGQDVRPANGKTLIELFKYSVKGLPKLKDRAIPSGYFATLDLVFQCLKGRRLIQTIGFTVSDAEADDAFDDLTNGIRTSEAEGTVAVWLDGIRGWVVDGTGELIGAYDPSDKYQKYLASVRGFA